MPRVLAAEAVLAVNCVMQELFFISGYSSLHVLMDEFIAYIVTSRMLLFIKYLLCYKYLLCPVKSSRHKMTRSPFSPVSKELRNSKTLSKQRIFFITFINTKGNSYKLNVASGWTEAKTNWELRNWPKNKKSKSNSRQKKRDIKTKLAVHACCTRQSRKHVHQSGLSGR